MQLSIATNKKDEIIDITEEIEKLLEKQSVTNGVIHIFVQHTTCCVTAMDLDPGTDLDFLDAIRGILPDIRYRHPHDPSHAPDHILAGIIGPSLNVPFEKKELLLGTWQRIVLIELDGPRDRSLQITVL